MRHQVQSHGPSTQSPLFTQTGLYLYYLYCFFLASRPLALRDVGIDGESITFSISDHALGALVSRVPDAEYNEVALQENLEDLEWVTPRARRHEQIIRAAAAYGPVIPVRFCTLYKSRERIQKVLRNHQEKFVAFLHLVEGKEEWGVKVYLDDRAVAPLAQKASPSLHALEKGLRSASVGESYLLKKKRDRLLQEATTRSLDLLAEELYVTIRSWAAAGQRSRLSDRRVTGRQGVMILNAAFLVDQKHAGQFLKRLDRLVASHENRGLSFEKSGPWPPYNFCPQPP